MKFTQIIEPHVGNQLVGVMLVELVLQSLKSIVS